MLEAVLSQLGIMASGTLLSHLHTFFAWAHVRGNNGFPIPALCIVYGVSHRWRQTRLLQVYAEGSA